MTRKELDHLWRNLSFWKRLLIECVLCVAIALLVELTVSGRSGDFVDAVLGGAGLGLFFAIIDHAFFAGDRTRKPGQP
jgi:hypothetical protein